MDQPSIDEDARVTLVRSLWLVAAAMTVHELEEWNIASWGARNFENHTGISQEAIWIGIVFITVVFVSWIFLATRLRSPLAISLAALPAVALVAVGNSVQHITWAFLFGEYAPGVVSAVLLVLPASGLAMWNMLQQSRLLAIPMVACVALWVASSVQIVDAGHVLQPFQLVLQRFFISMTTALGLPGVGGAV
jgi:hypothetical protein